MNKSKVRELFMELLDCYELAQANVDYEYGSHTEAELEQIIADWTSRIDNLLDREE